MEGDIRHSLDVLEEMAKSKSKKVMAIACADDGDVLKAATSVVEEGLLDVVLVGDKSKIKVVAEKQGIDISSFKIIEADSDKDGAYKAVSLVREGKADFLMKGSLKTSVLLKAVLDKEHGLRKGNFLSHLFLIEIPALKRVYGVTDGGVNIAPDLEAKVAILKNAVECYHLLGISEPKVAVLAAVEVVNPAMPATLDAAALVQMNRRGQIKGCIVDGPLALDNAVSKKAAEHKGIKSPVAGEADILLAPDIESCNLLGKSMFYMAKAVGAGVVLGAKVPVVLTSRADRAETKRFSILLGAVLS